MPTTKIGCSVSSRAGESAESFGRERLDQPINESTVICAIIRLALLNAERGDAIGFAEQGRGLMVIAMGIGDLGEPEKERTAGIVAKIGVVEPIAQVEQIRLGSLPRSKFASRAIGPGALG